MSDWCPLFWAMWFPVTSQRGHKYSTDIKQFEAKLYGIMLAIEFA